MRVHSTGLGKDELKAEQNSLEVKNGYFLFTIKTTEPVHWHIRVLMDRRDVFKFLLSALKGPIFVWLISLFKKQPPAPAEF